MTQTRIRPLVEGGILSAIAIVFALMSAYLPILGPFVNMLWPVPIILLGVRHGFRWSVMATLSAGVLIAVLMHPLHALSVVVGFGLIGIVLGHAIREAYSPGKALVWGSLASLLSKVAVLGLSAFILGINPLEMQIDVMAKGTEEALAMYRSMGMQEEELQRLAATMGQLVDVLRIILPAGFAMAAVVDTYLNFIVARLVLRRLGMDVPAFPPFREWRFHGGLAYAYALALVGAYWGSSREWLWLRDIAMNVQVVASLFLFVQGLALVVFLTDKYRLPKFVRGLILLLLVTNGFLTQMVIYAGVAEAWVDVRRLRKPGEPS